MSLAPTHTCDTQSMPGLRSLPLNRHGLLPSTDSSSKVQATLTDVCHLDQYLRHERTSRLTTGTVSSRRSQCVAYRSRLILRKLSCEPHVEAPRFSSPDGAIQTIPPRLCSAVDLPGKSPQSPNRGLTSAKRRNLFSRQATCDGVGVPLIHHLHS